MSDGSRRSVLLAASEVEGFAKTGGLADVAASLPKALARRGNACSVVMPLYRCVRTGAVPISPTGRQFHIPIGNRLVPGALWRATLPGADLPVYLVEQPDYFERDDPSQGRGLYQRALPDGGSADYPDNAERFIFFCRAVLEALPLLERWPDVLHLNDWQTGLVPVYVRELYRRASAPGLRERYSGLRSLFTIHNLAYQGQFWHWDMLLTGLAWPLFNYQQLEFYGGLNFLKAGIVFADLLNTVSPTYAREIQTKYFGCGLDGVLAERRDRLYGIVNGVDYEVWNPGADRRLPARYDAETFAEGKAACKEAVQKRYGLEVQARLPLIGMVSRLAEQKGIDLAAGAMEVLLERGECQFVALGEGEVRYRQRLKGLAERFGGRMGLTVGFDDSLAHLIEAGADLFLMPSLYEPSGLSQLYSLRYGCVPVVRATGGLADTITDTNPETLAAGVATGFTFVAQTAEALREAVERALALYRQRPDQWAQVVRAGMRQDWSWDRSAAEYERLYDKLSSEARGGGADV